MGLTYVIIDIIKSSLGWKNNQKCFDSTSRMGLEDLAKSRRFFPGNTLYWMGVNSLYLGDYLNFVGQNKKVDDFS